MTFPASIIPSDFLVPGTAHAFNYLKAGGSLVNVPFVVALIGTKRSTGTAVVGQVYDATDPITTDALGGVSGEGALMARQAYLCALLLGQGPLVKITFINEPGGGTAHVQTVTFVGACNADSQFVYEIAGRSFTVTMHNGDSVTTLASNVVAEVNKIADQLPVLVTSAAGVVTHTHPTKGVNGADVKITIRKQCSGSVATLATSATGAGTADLQPALDALSPLRYDGISIANHASGDITELLLDQAARWAVTAKTWAYYFMFEPGTIGTGTALSAASNHQAFIIGSAEGCPAAPGEGAVTLAMLAFSRPRPNSGYDGAVVPLPPPDVGTLYTPTEQNTAIHAGLTPLVGVIDATGAVTAGRMKVVQMVTSRTTTNSLPDDRNRDIAVSRTGIALAIQLDIAYEQAQAAAAPSGGINQSDSEVLLVDLGAAILRAEARASPPVLNPDLVEADVAAIRVVPDSVVVGRNNVKLPYHPETPLHQVGWEHFIVIGA